MEQPLCIHGVRLPHLIPRVSSRTSVRAVGIRVADSVPVLFSLRPTPCHEGVLASPSGFKAGNIVPYAKPSCEDDTSCILFGDYPECVLSKVRGYEDLLLVDARTAKSEEKRWPDVWKVSPDGQLVDRSGSNCGNIATAGTVATLVLTDRSQDSGEVRVKERVGDEPQPHPWKKSQSLYPPQELHIDGVSVEIPGGPYTILVDGGTVGDVVCAGVDDLAAVFFDASCRRGAGAQTTESPARHVYVGDTITDGRVRERLDGGPQTICATMIVRNEGKTIRRALENARCVADTFCICDTGSSDNTVREVESFLEESGCKGRVFSHPFRDFGYNRTVSWAAARGLATYQLFIDADHVIQARSDFNKNTLTGGSYIVLQNTHGCTYWNLRLARDEAITCCQGVTHEYWQTVEPPDRLENLRIIDVGDGGSKKNKFDRDVRLLKRQLVHTPNDPRTWFYLANTHRDRKEWTQAIEAYQKRIELGGWMEEVWCSQLNIGRLHARLGDTAKAAAAFLDAHQTDPARAENLVDLAQHYRESGKTILAGRMCALAVEAVRARPNSPRLLFVEENVYQWRAHYELSLVRLYMGGFGATVDRENQRGLLVLLASSPVPADHLIANHRYYAGRMPRTKDAPTIDTSKPSGCARNASEPIWCTVGSGAGNGEFMLAGWCPADGKGAVMTWSGIGTDQSIAGVAHTDSCPILLNSDDNPWVIMGGRQNSMLLATSTQDRRMSPVQELPPMVAPGCMFRRGQALMVVTSWVPFACTELVQGVACPAPPPLPWREMRPLASAHAGPRGTWFLLRLGQSSPVLYSLLRVGGGEPDSIAWCFTLDDDDGTACGLWLEDEHLVIPTYRACSAHVNKIPLDALRWSRTVECVSSQGI